MTVQPPSSSSVASAVSAVSAPESAVTIYHNARCSNSRGALAILREAGIEPHIVDYIANPLNIAELTELIAKLEMPVRDLMRSKEAIFQELNLDIPEKSNAELIAAIASHPVLLNRPIVVTPRGALLCRPPEKVLQII